MDIKFAFEQVKEKKKEKMGKNIYPIFFIHKEFIRSPRFLYMKRKFKVLLCKTKEEKPAPSGSIQTLPSIMTCINCPKNIALDHSIEQQRQLDLGNGW